MKLYSDEMKVFIKKNVLGLSTSELCDLVNAEFGTSLKLSQIRSFKNNHGLQNGLVPGRKQGLYSKAFPKEIKEYIYKNYKGIGPSEMSLIINKNFGTDYKKSQIRGYYKNHKLVSGVDTRFKKGDVSHNKGKKGLYYPGSENGWFKKGDTPPNHRPVGSERVDVEGYTLIKTLEPSTWEFKHQLIWKSEHGEVPDGHKIMFKDGNSQNITLDNLALVSDYELLILNRKKLISDNPEFTEAGINIAKVFAQLHNKRKEFER